LNKISLLTSVSYRYWSRVVGITWRCSRSRVFWVTVYKAVIWCGCFTGSGWTDRRCQLLEAWGRATGI